MVLDWFRGAGGMHYWIGYTLSENATGLDALLDWIPYVVKILQLQLPSHSHSPSQSPSCLDLRSLASQWGAGSLVRRNERESLLMDAREYGTVIDVMSEYVGTIVNDI